MPSIIRERHYSRDIHKLYLPYFQDLAATSQYRPNPHEYRAKTPWLPILTRHEG